tara:strand:- start:598 stop:924 length:327 start_codon:yes stop_codon:yes gene_type:complete
MNVDNLFWGMVIAGVAVGITQKNAFSITFSVLAVLALIVYRRLPASSSTTPTYALTPPPSADDAVPSQPPSIDDPTMNTQLFDYSMTSNIDQPEPVEARQNFLRAVFA